MALQLRKTGETFEISDADAVSGGDPDAVYTLRRVALEEVVAIRKKHFKIVRKLNPNSRAFEEVEDSSPEAGAAFARELIDLALVDWRGVVDGASRPVPCTAEWKQQLDLDRIKAINEHATGNAVAPAPERQVESFPVAAAAVADVERPDGVLR